ncbi:MAG: hypothetical protein ACRCTZ_08280 [Sarcina sp.]
MLIRLINVKRGTVYAEMLLFYKGHVVTKYITFRMSDNIVKNFELFKKANFIKPDLDKNWSKIDIKSEKYSFYDTRKNLNILNCAFQIARLYSFRKDKIDKELTMKELWDEIHFNMLKFIKEKRFKDGIKVINPILYIDKTFKIVEDKDESI